MSDPQRREFLAAAAGIASLATLSGAQPAAAGDPSFMNNVPDPALSGKDLPTFKFALEKSAGKVIGNSFGKEATVEQLPISKGIAGVRCGSSPARCASCTGTRPRRSGRSSSRGAFAPR
jgi:oxalate decarboxylase